MADPPEYSDWSVVTDAWRDKKLDILYGADAKPTTITIGLIDATGYTDGPAQDDTLGSHPGWSEFTDYSGARPTWTAGAVASDGGIDGSVSFTFTASGTIRGVIVIVDSILKSAMVFEETPVVDTDTKSYKVEMTEA